MQWNIEFSNWSPTRQMLGSFCKLLYLCQFHIYLVTEAQTSASIFTSEVSDHWKL